MKFQNTSVLSLYFRGGGKAVVERSTVSSMMKKNAFNTSIGSDRDMIFHSMSENDDLQKISLYERIPLNGETILVNEKFRVYIGNKTKNPFEDFVFPI